MQVCYAQHQIIKWDYMDAKGIETIRRDNFPSTKNLIQSVLDYVLIKSDTNKALEYTKNTTGKLLQNKIDLSSLNKIEDYKVKAAHVELVHRMKKRKDKKKIKWDYNSNLNDGFEGNYL